LFTANDVTIFGLRYAESNSTDVLSANLDTRFRIGRRWRISPRLRVDYREIRSDQSTQWIYSPGIRLHYRHDQRFRFELEAGTQFSNREMAGEDQERKSYFVNAGYQWLF
jgi:maltoporin